MPVQSLRWNDLGTRPRVAVAAVLWAGLAILLWALAHWQQADQGLFIGYVIVATAASALRIRLPGLSGSLSLHFFFVLLCLAHLSVPETMVIGAAGALLQCITFMKPPRLLPVLFEISVSVISTGAAALVYGFLSSDDARRSPLLLVVAGGMLFLCNTLPTAGTLALAERRPFLQLWRDNYFWMFPHYVAGGGAAGLLSMAGNRTGLETGLLIVPVIYWMYNSYRYYLQLLYDERRQVRELGALHFRTIEALALAIEGHDPTKHGQLRRVSIYVTEIGKQMGLTETDLQALHAAAMLHDIGKLAVPEHIITKPGKLTDMEFERLKVHPIAGAEILEQVQFPYPVAPMVRSHHERWDGSGYPAGLKGTQIPLGARILAAVDCLDALVSDRYHRRALSMEQAVDYLRAEAGKSFDPEVVEILAARYREFEEKVQRAQANDLHVGGLVEQQLAGQSLQRAAGSAFLTRIAAARQEEQHFFQLARDLGNSLSLDRTLEACAERLQAMCPCDSVVIFLRHDKNLLPEYAQGLFSEYLTSFPVQWGKGVAGWVAEQRTPVINGDPSTELALCGGPTAAELKSVLAVPIEGVSEFIGVIALYSRSKEAFSTDHLRVLGGVASRASVAIENSIKYSQAERSATTDVLTGLANARSLFLHLDGELARARRHHDSVTVLVCDLDRFKQLNDLHGHMEGNRALKLVAQAIKKQCREYDFVARMGGDEFVVVLPSHRLESIEAKVDHLRQAVSQAGSEIAGAVSLGMSVGHASFPDDGEDAEALLATADRRMYRMKQQIVAHAAESAAAELRRLSETVGIRPLIH
ncbi:MAG: HD domain-containing phosphohydrolase [Acidobacteriota bacterium]